MIQVDERRVDAVILTALPLEYDEILKVDAGAAAGSRWEQTHSEGGLPVAFRRFTGKGDRPLRVAVAVAPDMGATAGIATLSPLVDWLEPRCIAMCGVCAGRADKGVLLGDVIAADRVYYHDTGKQRADGVEQDLNVYKLRDDWKLALGRMDPVALFGGERWFQDRPLTTEWREQRALVALRDRVAEPWTVVDPAMREPDWQWIVASLRERKLLAASGRELTEDGLRFVDDLLFAQMGKLPDVSPAGERHPLRLHVAPIGSGMRVIEDEKIWREVSQSMRKTLGIEMEAAMIGELAHRLRHRKLDWLVMKGVMDFADRGRDDHFKEFAARASAECLLWFLREHLAPDPVAGFDNVLETRMLPLPAREASPAMLLAAPFAVVRWHHAGRADVLAQLDTWADDPSQPVAVRLIHAEGGVGKTRLAIEWLQGRRRLGNTAGFLPLAAKDDWLARTCRLGAPVVVAVDYAETRADLVTVLRCVAAMAAAPQPAQRVRVLLLARGDGDWWQALLQGDVSLKVLLTAHEPIELAPLAATPAERQAVFDEALAAFAEYRKQPVPPAQIVADTPDFDRVLYLHMAALAAVERSTNPSATASSAASPVVLDARLLMDEILDHEQRFWQRDRQQRRPAAISLAQQLVAAATLRGGIAQEAEVQGLCKRLSGRERTDADDELLALLHDVYAAEAPHQYLPGLQPDLLGEAMVLRVAAKQADAAWIERVVVAGDDTEAVASAFTVLARASGTVPATATPWLATLLRTEFAARAVLALRAAKAVGQRTAFSPLGDLLADALERNGTAALTRAIADEPIPYPTVSLQRVAEWGSRIRLAQARSGDDQPALAERAARLTDWGIRVGALGNRAAALDAIREAVKAHRALATQNPDAFRPDLAGSLTNLGVRLSEVGQRIAALDATREAVEVYRALATQNPDAFRPDLARSLHNLGVRLSEVGQREAALGATREAVEVYRALAAQNPDAFCPDLAMSLNNLGLGLSEIGRCEAALDATCEAVKLHRALAAQNPDAFLPNLAASLNNLGNRCSDVGQHEAALNATREAVEAYRALAAQNPDAFLPNLAAGLNNLGNRLSEVGQHDAALDATREAVDAYRALAAQNPDAFLPDLAMSLNNLGGMLSQAGRCEAALADALEREQIPYPTVSLRRVAEWTSRIRRQQIPAGDDEPTRAGRAKALLHHALHLSDLGQREAALAATQEAVATYGALAARNPDAFAPKLAASLNNLGNRLGELGRREAALAASQEAVATYRALTTKNPDAFAPDLAMSLNNLGTRLHELGRREAALTASQEAVATYRALVAKNPDAFAPDLAMSLNNLGNRLSELGQREAALAASQEAVATYRALAAKNPDAFAPDLAGSLNNLGSQSHELGQREAALAATQEAVTLRRALATKNPDAFAPDLAASLNNLGVMLRELGQREAALAASQEAAATYRALTAKNPDAFAPDLAASSLNLGARLSELGQREAGLVATQEAVATYRALAAKNPDAFAPDLAGSLNNLGNRLNELGRGEAGLVATQEAVTLRRALAAKNPDAFAPDLAASVNNLGNRLSELRQYKAALVATQEAVTLRRALAAKNPDAFARDLAGSLNNLGATLSELGQREAALAAAQEAVTLRRALAAKNPDAFAPDLTASLNNLGTMLSELGQHEAALAAAQEAVAAYRALAAKNPDAFARALAASLNNLGAMLSELGQHEAALAAAQDAVATYRALAAKNPDAFAPDLAASLNNLRTMLSELGQHEAALAAAQEAVAAYRALAAKNPDAFAPDLAASLDNLGVMLSELSQHEAALAAAQDAVATYRALAAKNPDAFAPELAASLNNLGVMLSELSQHEAALAATQEAVATYRALADKNPDAFAPDLAMSLNNLGILLSELGQREAALAATQEAVATYRALADKNPDAFASDLAMSLNNLSAMLSDLGQRDP